MADNFTVYIENICGLINKFVFTCLLIVITYIYQATSWSVCPLPRSGNSRIGVKPHQRSLFSLGAEHSLCKRKAAGPNPAKGLQIALHNLSEINSDAVVSRAIVWHPSSGKQTSHYLQKMAGALQVRRALRPVQKIAAGCRRQPQIMELAQYMAAASTSMIYQPPFAFPHHGRNRSGRLWYSSYRNYGNNSIRTAVLVPQQKVVETLCKTSFVSCSVIIYVFWQRSFQITTASRSPDVFLDVRNVFLLMRVHEVSGVVYDTTNTHVALHTFQEHTS